MREGEVQEILPEAVAAALQRDGHRQRRLEVVAGPAAVEVELRRALRFTEHAFDEVVPVREGARHAGRRAESLGRLPGHEERHDASE